MAAPFMPRRSTTLDPYATRVDALMTRDVVVTLPDRPVREAAATMLHERVTGLPVVDDYGVPIGVLSLRDVVRAAEGPRPSTPADAPTIYYGALRVAELLSAPTLDLSALTGTVRDHMSHQLLVCKQFHAIASAARSMADHGVHRLLVVNEGKLVGLLSALDIANWVGHAGGQPS